MAGRFVEDEGHAQAIGIGEERDGDQERGRGENDRGAAGPESGGGAGRVTLPAD